MIVFLIELSIARDNSLSIWLCSAFVLIVKVFHETPTIKRHNRDQRETIKTTHNKAYTNS